MAPTIGTMSVMTPIASELIGARTYAQRQYLPWRTTMAMVGQPILIE
jgi:hypothetical protein